jgi:pimeloyl-ACP methyl ester carboxylesterase
MTRIWRTKRSRLVAGALLAFAATSAIALSQVGGAAASQQPQPQSNSPKPTIVLVHGGWADSSGWNSEVTALTKSGYDVIAPANPLRGLASDADYIRSVLKTITGPIVLVGHSYGGAVISNAAVGVPNVKALVYIAAFAPDNGESLLQLVTKNPGTLIGPKTTVGRPYPLPDGGQGVDLYLAKAAFRAAFAGDLPVRVTDQMFAEQRPFSQAAFVSQSGPPAWKTVPSWYLVATQDHAIPPVTQRFMAHRAGARVVAVKSSHVAMISQPKATTNLILQAARSVQ